ncbi:MAG: DUF1385 domain-containing protein [Armatimonadota bacterium]|nr:DUF1385 domain-containing protein [Armatimonadota bacterium]MDR5675930.1 DUF1385 domain-containing protein [Armatimonadota bacterium]MDR7389274.1 DUF1385 domain-containing protein [Armatimonadota bacterium]MDR7394259.1 DUF1385 domain-containing protein [Armatimonadota bacterium]MDR7399136.1 DUF1385 domain-containing protein [Armatimonadota bacterium]
MTGRLSSPPRATIGGQAVLEGVMIRGPHWVSTAVRRPDGAIAEEVLHRPSALVRRRWARLPVVRGAVVLWEALVLGTRALVYSASQAVAGELGRPLSSREVALSLGLGVGLAVGLFFVLPTVLVRWVDPGWGVVSFNLVEGLVRAGVLVLYVGAVGAFPEIRRVFMYHGAEHKVVNAWERGVPLVVDEVQKQSRFHPRCGTSFLLVVVLVAVGVFSLLGKPPLWARVVSRVLLVPLIAGVAYEVIRAGARSRWLRPLVAPGIWLQRLTTREPDPRQVEVAIRALQAVLDREDSGSLERTVV